MCEPWERQPGESHEAFEAFQTYRDMGPARSLAKVGEKLGKSTALMERWSSRHGWVERVAAWEAEEDRHRREAHLQEIEEMSKRQAQDALAIQQALSMPVTNLLEQLRDDPDALTAMLDGMDIGRRLAIICRAARVLPGVVNIERLARGVPTEIHAGELEIGAKRLEERLALAREIQADPVKRRALHEYLSAVYGPPTGDAGAGGGEPDGPGDPREPGVGGAVDDRVPPAGAEPGDRRDGRGG